MDAERFDALARSLGVLTSRRAAVKRLSLLGAIAALFGNRVSAQDDEAVTCMLAFHAETATGPNEDTTYEGVLTLIIEPEGEVDDAFLESDGEEFEVVGQAVGRALSLRIELNDDRALSLHGVGERAIAMCRGDIAGTFGGPEMRDLGTWMASSHRSESAITNANATSENSSAVASGTTATTSDAGGSGSDTCPDAQCTPPFVAEPQSCKCICPAPLERCGDACCFGGSDCNEATGDCSCPAGSSPCQDICTPSCAAGETLDPVTCQCPRASWPPPRTHCGGLCVDTMTDNGHCGECNFNCNLPKRCIDGICFQCMTFEDTGCTSNEQCCSGFCVNEYEFGWICAECPAGLTICALGVCADLTTDTLNCGACGNDCGVGSKCDEGNCVPTSVAPSG